MSFIEKNWSFTVSGLRLAGRVLLPQGVDNPGVVVMAHGFGAEAAFGLEPFARRFVDRGLAVFVFDYRSFGPSEGEPRNYVHPFRHLADWRAAVASARSFPGVDGSRVGIWGTSFSGGHVIVTAATVPGIRAVVAQVPFVDGFTLFPEMDPGFLFSAVREGLLDAAGALLGKPTRWTPLAGAPGAVAALNKPGVLEAFYTILPQEIREKWPNQTPSRALLMVPFYRPIRHAARVKCPALVIAAEHDNLIPVQSVVRAAARMPNARLVRMPVGHFDPYTGEPFEKAVALEADFFEKHLK